MGVHGVGDRACKSPRGRRLSTSARFPRERPPSEARRPSARGSPRRPPTLSASGLVGVGARLLALDVAARHFCEQGSSRRGWAPHPLDDPAPVRQRLADLYAGADLQASEEPGTHRHLPLAEREDRDQVRWGRGHRSLRAGRRTLRAACRRVVASRAERPARRAGGWPAGAIRRSYRAHGAGADHALSPGSPMVMSASSRAARTVGTSSPRVSSVSASRSVQRRTR